MVRLNSFFYGTFLLYYLSLNLANTKIQNNPKVSSGGAHDSKGQHYFKFLQPNKFITDEQNWVEKSLQYGSSYLSKSTNFLMTTLFIITGITKIASMFQQYFTSPKEAARDVGLVKKMFDAEGRANVEKEKMLLSTSMATHSSQLIRFLGCNYYSIIVLFIFLNVCFLVLFFNSKFNRAASETTAKRRLTVNRHLRKSPKNRRKRTKA